MVDIIGGIRGLETCDKCRDEVRKMEKRLKQAPEVISFFSDYLYPQEMADINSYGKDIWKVTLDCHGKLYYKENSNNSGQIIFMKVECNE
jgi:hypothetical protein